MFQRFNERRFYDQVLLRRDGVEHMLQLFLRNLPESK